MKLRNGKQQRRLASIVEYLFVGFALKQNLDHVFVAVERSQMKSRKAVVFLDVDELRRVGDKFFGGALKFINVLVSLHSTTKSLEF